MLIQALASLVLIAPDYQDRPDNAATNSAEVRAYIESLGDIGDHGRAPDQTQLDFSARCGADDYRFVISNGAGGVERPRVKLEILEQPGGILSPEDRAQVQSALSKFWSVGSVNLHCWNRAGYRYFVSGSVKSEDDIFTEKMIAIIFNGEGRFDRIVE